MSVEIFRVGLLVLSILGISMVSEADDPHCPGTENSEYNKEKELIRCLLKDYEPYARPVKQSNESVLVKLNIATFRVEDIDEKNQLLRMKGWIFQQWKDPNLTWTPANYDNIYQIRLPVNRIWSPDVVIYNYAEDVSLKDESHSEAAIMYDGTVGYYPIQTTIKTGCLLNMRNFPYDEQTCWLALGSATNSVDRLNITVGNASVKTWYEGHEWKTMGNSIMRIEHEIDGTEIFGGKARMAIALYSIVLKRNPVYHQHVFVLPIVLLTFVMMFVFLVPPQAHERLTLCGAILIGITVLLLMLENHLPTEVEHAPLILRFLVYLLFVNMVLTLTTVVSLNCYHRDIKKGKVPTVVRKIFLGKLPRLLCLKLSAYDSLNSHDTETTFNFTSNNELNTSTSTQLPTEDRELFEDSNPLPKSPTLSIEKTMEEIRKYLRMLASRPMIAEAPVQTSLTHRQIVLNEWHQVALVIDRFMFVWFSALTLFIALVMSFI